MGPQEQPWVSVLIPVYNQERFIQESLVSVLEQDYSRLKVVVADNASTDETPRIIASLAKRYPERLVPIFGTKTVSVTENGNRAFKACRGKYLAFFAGDDIMLPGKIAVQVKRLEENPQMAVCGHDVEIFDSETGKCIELYSKRHPLGAGGLREMILGKIYVPYCSAMLRFSCVPPQGSDERLPVFSDGLLMAQAALAMGPDVVSVGCVPGTWAKYRRHADNLTKLNYDQVQTDYMRSLDLLGALCPKMRDPIAFAQAERLTTWGFRSMIQGEFRNGFRGILHGLNRSWRGSFKACINGLRLVFSGRSLFY